MIEPASNNKDIVIVAACRTPFIKVKREKNLQSTPDELLYKNLLNLLDQKESIKSHIQMAVLGNVCIPQGGVIESRLAFLKAQLNVPVMIVNRMCASGLDAIMTVANSLQSDEFGIAGGFEQMSMYALSHDKKVYSTIDTVIESHIDSKHFTSNELSSENKESKIPVAKQIASYQAGCTKSMGDLSEYLANKYKLTRAECDDYAIKSHKKSFEAASSGRFVKEIAQITIDNLIFKHDDGICEPNINKIISLKPCFADDGVSTAANSSQLSDGSSLLLLCNRETALKHKQKILGTIIDYCTVSSDPNEMGIAPVAAIQKLLLKNNLKVDDIVHFEINEAFATQSLLCRRMLKIPENKFNPMGGLGIGHPLGASAGRLVMTMLNNMDSGFGVVSLCAATGMASAMLLYKE